MRIVLLFTIILGMLSCTSFDSNKLNKKLVQGRWQQVEIISLYNDSIAVEKPNDQDASLFFWGDSCHEVRLDIDTERFFRFDINNYIVTFEESNLSPSYLMIVKLTNDSLILSTPSRTLKYIKVE